MKRTLLFAAVLALTGCERLHFLRPLYMEQEVVQEPALAGEWQDKDRDSLVIEASGSRYIFRSSDGYRAEVSLLRLAGELYADVVEEGPGIPDHQLFRVEVDGAELRLAPLNTGWALAQVKAGVLPAEVIEQGKDKDRHFVVTADAGQLQSFLLANAAAAWDEPIVFRRKP